LRTFFPLLVFPRALSAFVFPADFRVRATGFARRAAFRLAIQMSFRTLTVWR
jgi:hypothetical protein